MFEREEERERIKKEIKVTEVEIADFMGHYHSGYAYRREVHIPMFQIYDVPVKPCYIISQ